MRIVCIVAAAHGNVIGSGGDIPWNLPRDMKHFKDTTFGFPVIMGRKTFESIGKPLRGRVNIVMSRSPLTVDNGGIEIACDFDQALSIASRYTTEKVFVIGGSEIYKETQEFWDELILTRVDAFVEGNVYFPTLDYDNWKLVSSTKYLKDDQNNYTMIINYLERRG